MVWLLITAGQEGELCDRLDNCVQLQTPRSTKLWGVKAMVSVRMFGNYMFRCEWNSRCAPVRGSVKEMDFANKCMGTVMSSASAGWMTG